MAVLGSIGAAVYRSDMAGAPGAARSTLGGASDVASALPGRAGDALQHAANAAFTHALHVAAFASGVVVLGGAVLAVALLRGVATKAAPAVVGAGGDGALSCALAAPTCKKGPRPLTCTPADGLRSRAWAS